MDTWPHWVEKHNKNKRMKMGEEEKKELTREERTKLAASITKKLEDATKDAKDASGEKIAIIELAIMLLFPTTGARLIFQSIYGH